MVLSSQKQVGKDNAYLKDIMAGNVWEVQGHRTTITLL